MKKKSLWLILLIVGILFINVSVSAKELNLNILDTTSEMNCRGYFGDNLMYVLNYILTGMQIAAPLILLVLTTVDFSKVVFSNAKDGMDKAKKNFVKRAIMAVVIFFIPGALKILLSFINNSAIESCMSSFS